LIGIVYRHNRVVVEVEPLNEENLRLLAEGRETEDRIGELVQKF
jgi:hypothetical protein